MASILGSFTTQLYNLSFNLTNMYPNDPDIKLSCDAIFLMKKTNPRKLQSMFNDYIYIYHDEIMNRNENFLMKNDFIKDHHTDLSKKEHRIDYAKAIISNLRKYWDTMDDESKDNIWKYLQVLIVINKKIIGNA